MTGTKKRKGALWIVVAALAVAGAAWALRPAPVPVLTAAIQRGDLLATANAEGRTRVKELYVVFAPVDGQLQRVVVHAGDVIAADATVAEILLALRDRSIRAPARRRARPSAPPKPPWPAPTPASWRRRRRSSTPRVSSAQRASSRKREPRRAWTSSTGDTKPKSAGAPPKAPPPLRAQRGRNWRARAPCSLPPPQSPGMSRPFSRRLPDGSSGWFARAPAP